MIKPRSIMPLLMLAAWLLLILVPAMASNATKPAPKRYMGIDVTDLTLASQRRLGLESTEGVLVTLVVQGSPADSCGLRVDDLIVSIDAVPIPNPKAFRDVLSKYQPGDQARIKIIRDQTYLAFDLTFGVMPARPEGGRLSWSDSKAQLIGDLLDTIDMHNQSMGSLAIADSQQIIFARALGYKYLNGDTRLTADPSTRYRIGSITKTFTAVMIFQLLEEGRLSLDTRLVDFFPTVPNADSISIAMMLTHQSGIFSFTDIPNYLRWSLQPRTRDEVLSRICSFPAAFNPGERHIYSNSNYLLLGYIIEALDGRDYAASLNARITGKIGLDDTYYGGDIDVSNNEAMSYLYMGYWEPGRMMNMDIPGGAGGIVSTASDLLRFVAALFKDKLISPQSLKVMLECEEGFGSGIFNMPMGTHSYYGHTGSIDNFRSILLYSPEDGYSLCWLSNGEADPSLGLIGLISAILSDQHVNIPQYVKAEQLVELSTLVGNYHNEELAMQIEIMAIDGEIYAQAADQPAIKLKAIDGRRFECPSVGLVIRFDPEGRSFILEQDEATLLFSREISTD